MELISLFKQYLTVERQYSEKTVTAYLEDIDAFQKFLTDTGDKTDLL